MLDSTTPTLDTDTTSTVSPDAVAPPAEEVVIPHVPTLYRHIKREQWGLGIVMRKLDDRLMVQFQDGRQRTFKEGYYHFLDTVDRQLDVTLGIVEALESMSDAGETRARRDGPRPVSMDEQIAYFRELYAGGFQDETYVTEHRGDGRARALKRHRDPLVALAKKHLSKDVMRRAVATNDASVVFRGANAVIGATGLVSAKERKRFAAMDESHHADFAGALQALLYGTSKLTGRFDAFVSTLERALGESPSWALTTVLLGAVHPREHVAVRERAFSLQTEWTAPGLSVSSRPMGLLYERLRAMAATVRGQLQKAGLEPSDLFDVGDFMWLTRKPNAKARIAEMRREQMLHAPKTAVDAMDDAESQAA